MEKWHVIALLILGIVLLISSILIRARLGEKYELKTIDLVLIILPLLFVLLISGKLKVLDAFGVKADFSELFADAAKTEIQGQVADTATPAVDEVVQMLEMAGKGGVSEIPRLIENRTQALVFRLGHGGYYGPAIKQYFEALYASSYLKYLIVVDQNSKLFCLYDVLDLAVHFRTEGEHAYDEFARWLNNPSERTPDSLRRLPGFVGKDQAMLRDSSKRTALERMDVLGVNSLPVVDAEGNFAGMVERSRLTSSLILEVADRIEGKTERSAAP